TKAEIGQPIELVGEVTHVDGDKVTVNLGIPVTVTASTLRLVTRFSFRASGAQPHGKDAVAAEANGRNELFGTVVSCSTLTAASGPCQPSR
ncbi:hypothetical protein RFM98_11265, partial [Mesorhizobium sp. VK9D]|nr:hypothetical protein [Mesorhizobium sp. VK9D]